MKTSFNLRSLFFWLFDSFRGGRIGAHLKDIRSILSHVPDKDSRQRQNQYLDRLLDHAHVSTPFYQEVKGRKLNDFPVINKLLIRENFDAFKSDDARYHKAATVVTSGSTGTPFALEVDKRKQERNSADTIFFGELAGFSIGQRLYYFKVWNKINNKNRLTAFAQNIIPKDVHTLDENAISETIETLKRDKSKKAMLAYSSVYDTMCNHLVVTGSDPIHCNLQTAIAMSEAFSPLTKERMKAYFGVHAVSRYSNVENGMIAQQLPGGSGDFLINEASYLVEILNMDSDQAVTPGTPGRIVITDLFNYRMPMIRYDTGDNGIMERRSLYGTGRRVLTSVEGRRMDLLYDTSGSLISSYVITNNMWKYIEIIQYQFIQYGEKSYRFLLNTDESFGREEELIREFTAYFGKDASIQVEYVDDIPMLASGKRKKVMNTWTKQ